MNPFPWEGFYCAALAVLAFLLFCGALGRIVGDRRGAGRLGAVLGLTLGPFGVLIACLLPRTIMRPPPRLHVEHGSFDVDRNVPARHRNGKPGRVK